MKPQKNICSAFVFIIIALLIGCSSTADKDLTLKPIFPDRHGWDLKQVTISDTDNKILEFKRVDCVWVIGNENKPTNESKVTALANKLVSIAPQGLVTLGADRYGDFKVGDTSFSRKVALTFKDKSSFTLLIGLPAVTKPAYLRLENKNEVYRVEEPLLKQIDLDSSSWLAIEEG